MDRGLADVTQVDAPAATDVTVRPGPHAGSPPPPDLPWAAGHGPGA